MRVRAALAEKTRERIEEALPWVEFEPGNNTGECAALRCDFNVNLWYVLDEDTPSVVYFRKQVRGRTGFDT